MSIQDMIKKSVLESGVFDSFNAPKMAISLIIALLLGAVIYMVYSKFYVGVIFSRSFAVTLVGMTLLTCMVTLAISTNIVISLGMVGALSIVRFRTAVKDPMDLVFLFWAIAEGILCGASLLPLALLGCPILGIFLLVFANHQQKDNPYLIIVRLMDGELEQKIEGYIRSEVKKMQLKSKTVTGEAGTEVIYEIRPKDNDSVFVNRISGMQGVESAVMVSYDGNYAA